ncbi:unnamed protein product [Heterobilharzia americana]|nr:unnamed protein product [Heterobilharzia americana]
MVENTEHALGNIIWWGLSPAVNFLECANEYLPVENDCIAGDNFLCIGMGDSRHILKTMSSEFTKAENFKTVFPLSVHQ